MRLLTFLAAIVVLFCINDSSVAQDRYSAAPSAAASAPSARALGLRLLTWPGKVVQPASAATPAPAPAAAATPAPRPAPAALPTSIYDAPAPRPAASRAPPAPAAPVLAQAAATPAAYPTARFYSVHRDYGQAPDPLTLSPQFLGTSSPDLAAPPPAPPRTVTTSGGRVQMAAPDDAAGGA
jgi:hypothetical protein